MAYSFKNQPTATATIQKTGANNTFKLAGINGEQTDAGNFRTAIADFIGIGGIEIGETLQRTINQAVESDGVDLQLQMSPSSITVATINQNSGNYINISSPFGRSTTFNMQLASAMTLSGKKLVGSNVNFDGNFNDRVNLRIYKRQSGGDYTTGEDSATINIHVNSVTISGTKYASTDLTFNITEGTATEFEDIT